MRGKYDANVKITGLNSARTLMYITPAANTIVMMKYTSVTDATVTPVSQQIECKWQRVNALGTPTATALTPSPHETGDQAAASVVKGNVTASEPTYVANTDVGHESANVLAGWRYEPDDEGQVMSPGSTWGLVLVSTPGTAFDANVLATFRELGG